MQSKQKFFITFLLVFALASVSRIALAQDNAMRVGIKGGLNVTNLYVDDVDSENPRYGFHVGVYTQLFESDVFAIQPEVLYSTKGTRAEDSNGSLDFNLNYLDIPVLAVFKLGDAAEIHVGPYFGYLLSANVNANSDGGLGFETEPNRDNFKSWDYGLAAGIGFNAGPVQIGARYNYGLQKIASDNSEFWDGVLGNSKNSNAQVYVSFNFNHSN